MGLINNIKPFIVHKVSDKDLFKACMEAQKGFKIKNISIVDENDHILSEFNNIMELKGNLLLKIEYLWRVMKKYPGKSKSVIFYTKN